MNNAAIVYGDALDTIFHRLNAVFLTNAGGAYATVEAFEHLLRKSSTPRIVNVTLVQALKASTPYYEHREPQYPVSKATMNMVDVCRVA